MDHQLKVVVFDTFFKRFRGLMGKSDLPPETWFLLKPCNSIHTMGMKVAIDVLFIDQDGLVLSLKSSVKPLKMLSHKQAYATLEAAEGTLHQQKIKVGDRVTW